MVKWVKNKQDTLLKKENIALVSITILLFIFYLKNIQKLGMLYVLDDEFGYWSNAAYLAGYDWSSVTSNIAYYSYGYSILLVPLFWIFENPVNMYRAAIVLNSIMLCVSFLICYDIARKLAKNVSRYILLAISFVISMYPAYIVQANIAWSECALIFLCWLITWFFLGLNEKASLSKFALLGFVSAYVYIIHQRAIGVLIASIMVVIIMKICKRVYWRQFGTFFLIIIVLLFINSYIKNDIQTNLYLSSDIVNLNDFHGQVQKIKDVFTVDGFLNFVKILAGQCFYLGASSCLLCFFAIYDILIKLKFAIINIVGSKSLKKINDENEIYIFVFLLIAFVLTIAISVIFMINPNRIDHLIYGRYNEMLVGPIILIGFLRFLRKDKISSNDFIFILIFFMLLTVITNLALTIFGFNLYNHVCAASIIVKPSIFNNYNVYIPAIIALLECMLIYFTFCFFSDKRIILFSSLACICCIFFLTGTSLVTNSIVPTSINRIQNIEISNFIRKAEKDRPIYFLLSSEFNQNSLKDLHQFLLNDSQIICVTEIELNSFDEDKFIIVTGINNVLKLINEYKYCLNVGESYLLISRPSKFTDEILYKNIKGGLDIPLDSFYKVNAIDSDAIQGNGTTGIFMYGPYISLESGNYKFTIELQLIDAINAEIGFIDVVADGAEKEFYKKVIRKSDFDENNKLTIEIPFKLEEYTDNLELRAYAYDGTQLRVNKISIK